MMFRIQALRVLATTLFLMLLVVNVIAGQWINAAISILILGLCVASIVLGYKQVKLIKREQDSAPK